MQNRFEGEEGNSIELETSIRHPSANVKKGIWIPESGALQEDSETALHIKDQFHKGTKIIQWGD